MTQIKTILSALLFLIFSNICHAQFFTAGDDPGKTKWSQIESPNYKVIYPEGLDSLARSYILELETNRIAVGLSAGYFPGQNIRGKMPVILHSNTAFSNGSVSWAPKRLDLYTNPDPYNPEAIDWTRMLSIHESRHDAQMQFGNSYTLRPFNWFFGEMISGLAAGLYPTPVFLEGDAVCAETALTTAGRGRSGEFLNYYMIAFDQGDFRSLRKWQFGSQRNYTPNHYALGYLYLAGIRAMNDCPDFMGEYLKHCAKVPVNLLHKRTLVKRTTGKTYHAYFFDIANYWNSIWQKEIAARGPFIQSEAITLPSKHYTEFGSTTLADKNIISVRASLNRPCNLALINGEGRETSLGAFATTDSKLSYSPTDKRIYWSENIPDLRWSLKSTSAIRYIEDGKARKRSLTKGLRLYNPTPHPSEGTVAAVEHKENTTTAITLINPDTGSPIKSVLLPAGMQAVDLTWYEDRIIFSALTSSGYGLYSLQDGKPTTLLQPQSVKMENLKTRGSDILFTCDRTGVNELYAYSIADGSLYQLTSTRYGSNHHEFSEDGKWLVMSVNSHEGKIVHRAAAADLLRRKVDFADVHVYPVAEVLSAQERKLAESSEQTKVDEIEVSAPKKYNKAAHLFNVHSWAPIYFNVDKITSMSYDYIYNLASLGALALSQNQLGTFVASAGYSAHKNPYDRYSWKHSGHLKMTYSGLYPVLEAEIDFNDRNAIQRNFQLGMLDGRAITGKSTNILLDVPNLSASFSAYVPLNFSSGGWQRGLIPKIKYNISNDMVNDAIVLNTIYPDFLGGYHESFQEVTEGKIRVQQSINASVRGYAMRPVATNGIFPKWGAGAEAGLVGNVGIMKLQSPMAYSYLYGYIPGFMSTHGVKMSMLSQFKISSQGIFSGNIVNTLPRGLAKNGQALSLLGSGGNALVKASLDYACPIYIGDIAIANNFMYIRRLTVTPHFDITASNLGSLYSLGTSLQLDMKSVFWIGAPVSIGLTYSYNGGSAFNKFKENGVNLGRHYIGPVFSVSLPN